VASLPGDVLEVGVWRGGSGCLLAAQERRSGGDGHVYLCDTFAGVVNAGSDDPIYSGGEHSDTSPQLVESLARSLGLDNIEILVGAFPDETAASIADRRFKFCHLDVDVYESTLSSADWLWPRLTVGGLIVVDDYGGDGMDGVQRAVAEFADRHDCRKVHNLNGHAILVKVSASH
jgi:O-methyltransferase